MEACAVLEPGCQRLMAWLGGQQRRLVARRCPGSIAAMLHEVALDRGRIDAVRVIGRFLERGAQHLGPFPIEVDQFLGNGLPFG
jgi:hypothetical protein